MGLAEEMLARSYARETDPAFRRFAAEVFGTVAPAGNDELALFLWDAAQQSGLCSSADARAALADLLRALFAAESALADVYAGSESEPFGLGLLRLADAHASWLRPVGDWEAPARDVGAQFGSLARHLLARFPVPGCLDSLLVSRSQPLGITWFMHVGAGLNLRTAPGLPVPLTRRMAHLALEAPQGTSFVRALRRGQVLGFGGSEGLAAEIGRSWLGRDLGTPDAEAWWSTVFQWLANQADLERVQVGPALDYLRHRKHREPALEIKGRTFRALLQAMDDWHRQLRRQRTKKSRSAPDPGFGASGLRPGIWRFGKGERLETWVIEEILTPRRLWQEGSEQGHCVGSYEGVVRSGQVSIWSLGLTRGTGFTSRVLTVEVANEDRAIVQARGKRNRWPNDAELKILRLWAQENALRIDLE